jgi:tetratricopeptide (TPR) repeat protein
LSKWRIKSTVVNWDYPHGPEVGQASQFYRVVYITVIEKVPVAGHCFAEQSWIFILLGKYREAKQMSERALRVLDGALANRGRPMALVCMTLAVVELRNGQVAEAERLLGKTFQLLEKQLSPDHPDIAEALVCRAACYQAAGKYKAADDDFVRALSILNSRYPHMDLLVASVRLMHEDFRRKYAHLL